MPLPSRRIPRSEDQPALPLDLGALDPTPPRSRRSPPRARGAAPIQFSFGLAEEDEDQDAAPSSGAIETQPTPPEEEDLPTVEPEPPGFDPDPFAEIPGFRRVANVAREFALLPGSLRGRLDLREFSRFLASLATVVKDWEGAPEIEEGGIRLRGLEGGAWVYPEANRVRLVTDGAISGPIGEDLVALCRWLDGRAGMRLYPAGETRGVGVDHSLDPWDAFLAS